MASNVITSSLAFLLNSGGNAYNTINSKLIEFVEADIETQPNDSNEHITKNDDVSIISVTSLYNASDIQQPDDDPGNENMS